MAGVGVTRTGSGMWHFATQSKKLEKMVLAVGWFSSARYDEGTPVAAIAAVQENGSPKLNIPPRPFIQPAIQKHAGQWRDDLKAGARGILAGTETPESVMEKMGLQVSSQIKEEILTLTSPALKPATVAARQRKMANKKTTGSLTKPLVDTTLMVNSLTYIVGKNE